MRTISVQQMPSGYEVEKPTTWDWMKAGAAFTFGAGCVYVIAALLWLGLVSRAPELMMLRAMTRF